MRALFITKTRFSDEWKKINNKALIFNLTAIDTV